MVPIGMGGGGGGCFAAALVAVVVAFAALAMVGAASEAEGDPLAGLVGGGAGIDAAPGTCARAPAPICVSVGSIDEATLPTTFQGKLLCQALERTAWLGRPGLVPPRQLREADTSL